jgi:hypothetical protein
MNAAAALLSVPLQYQQLLLQKKLPVQQGRRTNTYREAPSETTKRIGIEQIAIFLSKNGVHPDEAELWRPWATAYIEMEINKRPNSNHAPFLMHALDLTRQRIEEDPTLAFEQPQKIQRPHPTSGEQKPDELSPSPIITPADSAEPNTSSVLDEAPDYISLWDDEDTRMGPG